MTTIPLHMKVREAIRLATKLHEGQKDRCGEPYIEHPMAVLNMVLPQLIASNLDLGIVPSNVDEQIVAVLHDVIEDTPMTLEALKELGYSDAVVEAIDAISKRRTETYWEYIDRVKVNPVARKVKLADLKHNSDLDRLYRTGDKEFVSIAGRYAKAYFILREAL